MLTSAPWSPEQRKLLGARYTPERLADFVASKICEFDLGANPRILDPAVGDGELLAAIFRARKCEVFGFDVNQQAVDFSFGRLEGEFPGQKIHIANRDFLEMALKGGIKYDAVIANPPYVRTHVMGAKRSQELAKRFGLTGRIDICFAFIEGIAAVLRHGGMAGIIISNRFMTTKAGKVVRRRILENFDIIHVWDLGDTKIFDAAVLPAVLLLRRKDGQPSETAKFSCIYSATGTPVSTADDAVDALSKTGLVSVGETVFSVQHGLLDHSPGTDGVWRIATVLGDEWLAKVRSNTFCTFGDIGKIRVGVKTTADKVFIPKEWPAGTRPELLRPLVTHTIARRYKSHPSTREILYTHEVRDGKTVAVCLNEWPETEKYLISHRKSLESRKYVIDAGRKWFEIWVSQNPAAWGQPKLVFPDISEKPIFWMSLENEVVNGDCYWLAVSPEKLDLLWLALAVANSTFIEEFYDRAFNNKLYAGRRRFMSQYVEKFPLPAPNTPLAKSIVKAVKRIYKLLPSAKSDELAKRLDSDVLSAFGIG